jgi:hypothetical protein
LPIINLRLQVACLARAHDGDDIALRFAATAGAARWNRTGYVVSIDLAVGRGVDEPLGLAIGVGGRSATSVTRGQAAINAIAIRIVGNNEHALLVLRGRPAAEAKNGGEADQDCPHKRVAHDAGLAGARPGGALIEDVSKFVKSRLTLHPHAFHERSGGIGRPLTACTQLIIVRPDDGL